jgi:hypothetical protein
VQVVEFRDDPGFDRAGFQRPRGLERVRVRVEQHRRQFVIGGNQHVTRRADPHVVGETVLAHDDPLH